MPLGIEVGLCPGDFCVRWGPSSPSQAGSGAPFPNFWPMSIADKRSDASRCHIYCGPSDFVLDGDPAHPQKRGEDPNFRPMSHVYCDQTAACIKMPLVTEVGFGPVDIVLDGDSAPPSPKRGRSPFPQF